MNKVMACVIVCGISAAASAVGDDKKDTKPIDLNGTWKLIASTVDGKKVPADEIEKLKYSLIFKDGKYTEASTSGTESGTYKLDASKSPATIDFTIEDGPEKGKTQLGLLKLEGDVLTVAYAKPGSMDRPKGFDGTDALAVTSLKRSK
jgi:uncharacterized protein (TIGR03067 family)